MSLATTSAKFLQLVHKLNPFNGPPIPPDPESVVVPVRHQNSNWGAKIIVMFSLQSAIDVALLYVQVHSQLPIIFYFLSLAILLAFTCFFISKSVPSNCSLVVRVLERFGVFFGVTAFFIYITIPFPDVWFKCIVGFIYAISWLLIFFCKFFCAI